MTRDELYSKLKSLGFVGQAPIKWDEFVLNFGNLILPNSESVSVRLYEDGRVIKFYSSYNFGMGIGGANGDTLMLEDLTDELLLDCLCRVSTRFSEKVRNDKIEKLLKDEEDNKN